VGEARLTLDYVDLRSVRVLVTLQRIPAAVRTLTDRQRQICGLIGAGRSSVQIAKEIDLARETIDNHRSRIARTVGIKTWSLVAWCGERREWF
jgi:DNA-binding CsgD family transcriptional regulator